mgnify:CR=1 FL=1
MPVVTLFFPLQKEEERERQKSAALAAALFDLAARKAAISTTALPPQNAPVCAFFEKTGLCRRGAQCTRRHEISADHPSVTLVVSNMFRSPHLSASVRIPARYRALDSHFSCTNRRATKRHKPRWPKTLMCFMTMQSQKCRFLVPFWLSRCARAIALFDIPTMRVEKGLPQFCCTLERDGFRAV